MSAFRAQHNGGDLVLDWFGADKFDRTLRSALKHRELQIAEKANDNEYIITNGRSEIRSDITELRRKYSKLRDTACIAEFADRAAYELSLEDRLISFTNAQAFLRLIVLSSSEIKPDTISADFAGSLKKAVCYTGDNNDIYMLNKKYLKRWAVPEEVLFSVADRNMGRILSKVKYSFVNIGSGINIIEFETCGSPLVVSMMLCTDFREFVTEKLGKRFLVAAPSRETMIAVQEVEDSVLSSLGQAVVNDYKWADNPLSTDVFLYTPSEIKVAGHFVKE